MGLLSKPQKNSKKVAAEGNCGTYLGIASVFFILYSLSGYFGFSSALGGKSQYVRWAFDEGIGLSSSNDSFFFDPSIRTYFKAIFAWELINEPQCTSDKFGDTLQNWIEEMAGFVKSIDSKHLLTIGHEGFYGQRDILYKSIYDAIYESAREKGAGSGALIWQYLVQGMEEYNDDFGLFVGERPSIDKLIKKQSRRLANVNHGQDMGRRSLKHANF